ncbi:hypothetical protein HNY73_007374 [Argiope bruennichi]|uniref:Uncharacterized protein n=1 Tax=Argiope bruennichi TaxID=94029 RepID=A0A8T0FEB3_ARGBR|nr:hypothetical protein HNY73_007374 [Argiope bruennichi]
MQRRYVCFHPSWSSVRLMPALPQEFLESTMCGSRIAHFSAGALRAPPVILVSCAPAHLNIDLSVEPWLLVSAMLLRKPTVSISPMHTLLTVPVAASPASSEELDRFITKAFSENWRDEKHVCSLAGRKRE